jgi:hypothetical protein
LRAGRGAFWAFIQGAAGKFHDAEAPIISPSEYRGVADSSAWWGRPAFTKKRKPRWIRPGLFAQLARFYFKRLGVSP